MYGDRLATLDPETGKRPTSRIGNAGNARSMVQRLKDEDDTRMIRYTQIMGLLDGNPPWGQQKLRDLGQGHRANFNLREGEGMVDSAKTPYYDLIFEVPYFAQITLDIPGVEPYRVFEWEQALNEEYYETLCGWNGFDQNIQTHQWQMVVNGVGPIFWPHSVSWRSQAIKCRKVLVPQETPASVDELELVVVLHSWRADELESYISGADNRKDEDYNGWNVPLCEKAIIDCANREMQNLWGTENFDLYQRAIRTGDLFHGIHRSTRIYLASLFVREFGGKVSHYIITDQNFGQTTTYDNLEEEAGYLYKKKNKYDDFSQVVCPFFFDTGPDGTWHSVKGLGPKIYDFCDVSNRTFCQMLDGSVIGSGITLETQDGAVLEETQLALIGGGTVVAPGYKVVQTRIAESLQGAMNMRRELQNVLQSNTGSYRQRVADDRQEPTLGQAQLNYQQQAQLGKGATNRYCNSFNNFHKETLRRLMDTGQINDIPGGKEAKLFMARLEMRGVPPPVLNFKFVKKVRATPSFGYGSPQLRDMATKELLSMIPLMDEVSRNHALRARACALPGIGPSNVDSFFPKIENQQVPNAHHAIAMLENNALKQPNPDVIVEPGQNHSIHFDVHAGGVTKHQKDPNANPMELYLHMEQAGAHMNQHLQRIKNDPTRKGEIKQKSQVLNQFAKQADQLRQQIEEHAKAQSRNGQNGQQQQPDPEVMKVHGQLGLAKEKQDADIARKDRTAMVKDHLADQKTAADIHRKNLAAFHDLRRAHAEASANIGRSAAEHAGEENRKDALTIAQILQQTGNQAPQE